MSYTITHSPENSHHEADSRTILGFWVYLMTDCSYFATLFATYAVLQKGTNGGMGAHNLMQMPFVLEQTIIMIISGLTCSLIGLAAKKQSKRQTLTWCTITFVLAAIFLGMVMSQFNWLLKSGNSWRTSAFLSSYFNLVGTHALHVIISLLWMIILFIKVTKKGVQGVNLRRLTCLRMFWHYIGAIWVFIFTLVFLLGVV